MINISFLKTEMLIIYILQDPEIKKFSKSEVDVSVLYVTDKFP